MVLRYGIARDRYIEEYFIFGIFYLIKIHYLLG